MLKRRLLSLCVLLTSVGHAAEWKLPLEFEANRGQFAADVLFLARTPSHFVYLTRQGLTLGLNSSDQRGGVLRMQMVDADAGAPAPVAEGRAPGISNYFIGSDRSGWRRQVPHYERVRYRAVWPGIDLVFHGNGQTLEYDFSVAPGADPSRIRLAYGNARKVSLDADGGLTIETGAGRVVQRLPEIYQERDGLRTAVRGAFRIAANGEVRFEVGSYDRRRALVIDPTITYSTYIAGTGTMAVSKSAVDSAGNLYLTGKISSPDFPVVNPVQQFSTNVGLFRSANQGAAWGAASGSLGTAKVTSLGTDPSAAAIAYAGTSQGVFKTTNAGATWTSSSSGLPKDTVTSLTVDPLTPSTIYACTAVGFYKSIDGAATWKQLVNAGAPVAVAADSQTRNTIWLVYTFGTPLVSLDGGSTLLRPNLPQLLGTSVAIDPTNSRNVFVGTVSGGLFVSANSGISFTPITTGLAANKASAVTVNAIAINKQNPLRMLVGTNTGVYVSVTGGNNFQGTIGLGNKKVLSVIFDPVSSNIALAGTAGGGVYISNDGGQSWTGSGPANLDVNALAMSADEQSSWAGLYSGGNAFVTKINSSGTSILYSTYLGGSGLTAGYGIAVDTGGHAFVCGSTDAADFPVLNPYQSYGGGTDIFVSRLSASGSLDASTYLGGRADDSCTSLAADRSGNVYVAGTSILLTGGLSDFPTTAGVLGRLSFGGQDCVVAKFDNTLQNLIYSTFLGGNNADDCYAIAVDAPGNAYVVGATFSGNFLVTQGPFGGTKAAGSETLTPGFVSKINTDGSALIYSRLLGGLLGPTQLAGIAVNSTGRAYVTGYTSASDYPVTAGVMNATYASTNKAVITAIEADGSKLVYSTFLPGTHSDFGSNIALDAGSNAWVTGGDFNGGLAVTADAFPHTVAGSILTPWLVEVDATGANLLHATYLGGSAGGLDGDVSVGPDGSIYATGTTLSTDYTTTGTPLKQGQNTNYAGYLMRLSFPAGGGNSGGSGGGGTGNVPAITSVQSGASFQDGLSAGAWMTIKGTNLSATTDAWDKFIVNGQLPTKLDGVSVSIGGQAAYISFVSPGQINLVVPDVAAGTVNVTVTNALGTSAAFPAAAKTAQPAFFLWNNTFAVATRQDFSYAAKNGTFGGLATVAAQPGDVIILWGTGFGPTNPPAPSGVQLPASAFPTASPVTVSIGNAAATVYGAALAPGFAGLYQVAIQIPASLADGDYPVVATVGGQASPATAMISVQR